MWYKSQAGFTNDAELFRRASIFVLFSVNGLVLLGFLLVSVWYALKQRSKACVQWMPCTFPCFEWLMRAEEWKRWGLGDEEGLGRRDEWSFFVAQRKGTLLTKGAAATMRKKAVKLAGKLERVAMRLVAESEKRGKKAGKTAPLELLPMASGAAGSRVSIPNSFPSGGVDAPSDAGSAAPAPQPGDPAPAGTPSRRASFDAMRKEARLNPLNSLDNAL
jgi:hypothetical protein